MSDVTYASCDIRVYPNKELFAIDMAELINCSHLGGKHRIQGCDITLDTTTHALSISSGRVVIWGRLGVIEGGIIPVPEISSTSSEVACHIVAICDLADTFNPYTLKMVTPAEYEALTQNAVATEEQIRNFNSSSLMDFIDFGVAMVAPVTGYVNSWSVSELGRSWGTGRSIWADINNLYNLNSGRITDLTNTHNADKTAANNQRASDLSDINSSINGVSGRVTTNANNITSTNSRIDTTNSRIDTTNSRIDTNATEITNVKNILGPSTFEAVVGGIAVTWDETTVHKRNGVCMLTYRFELTQDYAAETVLFHIGENFSPYKRLRFFLIEWFTGARYRATISNDGYFTLSDPVSANASVTKTFMGELMYLTTVP